MAVIREPVDNQPVVIDYLGRNPNFFLDNPTLPSNINLPHINGRNIISLIEYKDSVSTASISQYQEESIWQQKPWQRQRPSHGQHRLVYLFPASFQISGDVLYFLYDQSSKHRYQQLFSA